MIQKLLRNRKKSFASKKQQNCVVWDKADFTTLHFDSIFTPCTTDTGSCTPLVDGKYRDFWTKTVLCVW